MWMMGSASVIAGFIGWQITRVEFVIRCVMSVKGLPRMNVPPAKTATRMSTTVQAPAPARRVITPTLTQTPVPHVTLLVSTAQGAVQVPASPANPL